ncbi:19381_t:CDS:2 [Cetraspora pellucida]|uniref:19381_t:CDS:1 n=2 Tax=Gigasporaceae TaxID=36753 RepID=A0A9N9N2M4_9GLOM|nr:19381_t:CDS:2 [Cetraspora pellucida]
MEFYESLSTDFNQLLEESDDYDMIIYVGKEPNVKKFYAHTVILRARSTYFRRALSRDWAKKENGSIVFQKPNITKDVFLFILKYIYTGVADLHKQDGEIILNILTASDELNLHELIAYAQDHLIQEKSDWLQKNVVHVLHTVASLEACKDLQDFCLGMICQDPYWPFEHILPLKLREDILQYYLKKGNIGQLDSVILPPRIPGIESNIIKFRHIALIAKWIDRKEGNQSSVEKSKYNFILLLRGTRDGFTAQEFHKLCDNQGPTVVVIKIKESGEIIGGYNPLGWRRFNTPTEGGWMSAAAPPWSPHRRRPSLNITRSTYDVGPYQSSHDSFLFSLGDGRNLENAKLSRISPENTSFAIFSSQYHGPCFGQTDLRMNDNFNSSSKCTCQRYDYETEICELQNFSVEEYEVFQVVDKNASTSSQSTSDQAYPASTMHPPRPEFTNYPTSW